jgi:hypothetical protein
MIDIATLTALATSAVAVLSPLLQKALEKGVEEIGKSSAGALFNKLKERLNHSGAKEALADLAKQPADPDAQGALRIQLRKALEADPALVETLKLLVDAGKSETNANQTTNTKGDHNRTIQIVGFGNSVS